MVAPALACSTAVLFTGCDWGGGSDNEPQSLRPAFLGTVTKTSYDGVNDDLLTAGLGATGLGAAAAPPPANPTAPTAAELRRLAIFNNYRAILDISPKGGYGILYGPNIDLTGNSTLGQGKIAGTEYIAYADDGTGRKNVTLMVQIPNNFGNIAPCIVTATSSGSRGVYGAIGSAGEWGLKHGCAVAYADKGTGIGVHDLATNTVNLQDGTRTDAITAGAKSNFTAALSAGDLAAFNSANPTRIAIKHAHSQQNPEKDWGTDTLNAIRFAYFALNEQFADKFADGTSKVKYDRTNTWVIASSVSNGGGASIAAAERDIENLINGVAVAEPVLELMANPALIITRGATSIAGSAKPLYDYFTTANLYQPCAALSPRAVNSPGAAFIPVALATNRCTSLKAKGLLTTSSTTAQAEESLDKLIAAGWQPESNILHASHYALATPPVVATYANAYGRFSVADNVCGFSYAATDASNKPTALAPAALAQIFGPFNGVGLSAGINIVNNLSPGGPLRDPASISPSSGILDFNADGANCQRSMWVGGDALAGRVKAGVAETLRSANLSGKPAIIVAGRADTLIPVNMNARPYYGQNKLVEGGAGKLVYIEVTNGQHFDAFIDNAALPGYDSNFIPLHYYFLQAMDRMWAYLIQGQPLPPSQLVRTTPRGGTAGAAPQITTANVPPISSNPPAADTITFSGNTLTIPD
ncbi:MAG TPA: 3-hydroxybutyrate oligomer hydrolase family protein [Casimicrobiaceae bacterium]|nr:3-hydroxybutyrate oligomer hydrolase family protein [Casimicrobiaceae bacterium]